MTPNILSQFVSVAMGTWYDCRTLGIDLDTSDACCCCFGNDLRGDGRVKLEDVSDFGDYHLSPNELT